MYGISFILPMKGQFDRKIKKKKSTWRAANQNTEEQHPTELAKMKDKPTNLPVTTGLWWGKATTHHNQQTSNKCQAAQKPQQIDTFGEFGWGLELCSAPGPSRPWQWCKCGIEKKLLCKLQATLESWWTLKKIMGLREGRQGKIAARTAIT